MNSFLSWEEICSYGFRKVGKNVLLSRKASIYGASDICIGDNVRIDDFCILSGRIAIGNYVHIAAYTAVYGGEAGVRIDDFANLSSRICVYAVSDDFSGASMTNPMVPEQYKKVQNAETVIGRHAVIGSGTTILQGVTVGEGAAVGAMSLVKKPLAPWKIYAGIPCKAIKDRKKEVLELEKSFMQEHK